MNLFSVLDQAAHRFPSSAAVFSGDVMTLTYAELRARALRLALTLRTLAGAHGRVAVVSENCTQFIEILFGTWAAECVVVPVNYKLHAKETAQILADAQATVVFVAPWLAEKVRAASTAHLRIVEIGSPAYLSMFSGDEAQVPATAPDALAWLFYTSGTTGKSKGAMLSHRNLMAMTVAHLADVESIDERASQIHVAPMSHGSGLYIPAYISRGARQVVPISGGFDPEEFLTLCDEHPDCGAFMAPTMVQRLRQVAQANSRRPKGLRSIIYGGGPMYVEELKKSLSVFGDVFVQIYGQGESPMTITWLRRQDHRTEDDAILGSVGWPRSGVEVRVVDGQARPVGAGEIGEIVCRGDVVMSGYWRNPAATAEALRDGWLYTGDMGSFDPRGYLTLRDRSKDVVISGGSNIYPREVEEALLTYPGVEEVCVVGAPDDEWGEIVVAFVVPTQGELLKHSDLDRHCLESIARFKRPKAYHLVDALPKNAYGKVLKRELRARLADRSPLAFADRTGV